MEDRVKFTRSINQPIVLGFLFFSSSIRYRCNLYPYIRLDSEWNSLISSKGGGKKKEEENIRKRRKVGLMEEILSR